MSDVINLFNKKDRDDKNKEKGNDIKDVDKKTTENRDDYDFEEIMKQNEAKKQKIAKEKLQDNKSVLRSYRIKH